MGSAPKPEKPKPTQSEIALAEIGAEQWQVYQSVYRPHEQKFIEESRFTKTEGERARSDAQALMKSAATQNALDTKKGLQQKGISLSSGAAKMQVAATANQSDAIIGVSQAKIGADQTFENARGLSKAIALGRNKAQLAEEGLTQSGQNQTRLAIANLEAQNYKNIQSMNDNAELFGAAAGAAYSMHDKIAPAANTEIFGMGAGQVNPTLKPTKFTMPADMSKVTFKQWGYP